MRRNWQKLAIWASALRKSRAWLNGDPASEWRARDALTRPTGPPARLRRTHPNRGAHGGGSGSRAPVLKLPSGLSCATRGGTEMAKIKKVGHVVLGVRDPARSVKFYTEVLGMELV